MVMETHCLDIIHADECCDKIFRFEKSGRLGKVDASTVQVNGGDDYEVIPTPEGFLVRNRNLTCGPYDLRVSWAEVEEQTRGRPGPVCYLDIGVGEEIPAP